MSKEAQDARRKLFGARRFARQAATRLELDERLVAESIRTLTRSKIVPCDLVDNSEALAVDGAAMLMAIGARHASPAATLRVLRLLATMTFEFEIGDPAELAPGVADLFPLKASVSFGNNLAAVLVNIWQAARKTTTGFKGLSVTMAWSDERGSVLFVAIEQGTAGRKRIYLSEPSRKPTGTANNRNAIDFSIVGGIVYSPKSLLRFAAHLDATMVGTAASLDGLVAPHVRPP